MGTWLHFAAKNTTGRMLAIWFPVMIFVLNGFQHLVANMFVIPAGILAGANITWGQFFFNMIPVFLGNVVGGASFVGASYLYTLYTYRDTLKIVPNSPALETTKPALRKQVLFQTALVLSFKIHSDTLFR